MELAGQGVVRPGRHSRLDDGGYIMVVLLIGMAVTAIWMAAALPSWRQQATREKELELIFRGQQYARAIALYARKNNNVLPMDIDTLVSQKYLRKKWKDPITNNDFLLVGGQAGASPGVGRPGGSGNPSSAGRGGSPTGGSPVGAQMPTAQGGRPGGGSPVGGGSPSGGTGQGGGVMGVFSKSTATSIIIYKSQQEYDLWKFMYTDALALMGVGQGVPSGAGPGRGNPDRGVNGRGGPQAPGDPIGPGPRGRAGGGGGPIRAGGGGRGGGG